MLAQEFGLPSLRTSPVEVGGISNLNQFIQALAPRFTMESELEPIFRLPRLIRLDLNNHHMKSIPASISALKKLQILSLTNSTFLETVSEQLGALPLQSEFITVIGNKALACTLLVPLLHFPHFIKNYSSD